MPKIKYTAAKGLVQEAGSGVEFQAETVSFTSTPFSPVQTISATGTITAPGVYAITSSTGGVKTITVPPVASFPGAPLVIRVASTDAHILTGTSADQAAVFVGQPGALPANVGSKLTFAAVQGTSVVLMSDGSHYCVIGGSGSFSLSETTPA